MRKNEPPMYAIRRARQGWRVYFVRMGVSYEKTFTDSKHGGTDSALLAAQAWRDDTLKSVPTLTKRAFSQIVKPTNTSGEPGVYLRKIAYMKAGKQVYHLVWQAQTPAGIRPFRSRSFGINRYGHDKAFELAVQARQCFLMEHDELNAAYPVSHLEESTAAGAP